MSVGRKIVAIASSTGGPSALQDFIPLLPPNLNAPVVLVQHMPAGFTQALAKRLDEVSPIKVCEARDGEQIFKSQVYLAPGGRHMKVVPFSAGYRIELSDEPPREGVRPCANYMYESLIESSFDEIICVVLTGMGADGTAGIKNLKENKNVKVFVQSEESCVVFGMPKAAIKAGLAEEGYSLKKLAEKVIENVGVI